VGPHTTAILGITPWHSEGLWNSIVQLPHRLWSTLLLCLDRTVLELGCGIGAFGILASRVAGRVVMTDGNPAAVEMARANMALNTCQNASGALLVVEPASAVRRSGHRGNGCMKTERRGLVSTCHPTGIVRVACHACIIMKFLIKFIRSPFTWRSVSGQWSE
jgi:16S rRNA G966 N2-methylase RsmD